MVPMVMNLNLKGSSIRPQKGLLQFHAQGFVAMVTSRDAAQERRLLTKTVHGRRKSVNSLKQIRKFQETLMSEMLTSPSYFQHFQLFLSHKRLEESRLFAEVESWKPYLTYERYESGSFFFLQPVGYP